LQNEAAEPGTRTVSEAIISARHSSPAEHVPAGVELRTFVSEGCGATGFSTGTATFAPHACLPYHFHEFSEAVTVIDGRARVLLEGRLYRLGPLDCVHVPAGLVHQLENDDADKPLMAHWSFATASPSRTLVDWVFPVENRNFGFPSDSDPETIIRHGSDAIYELSANAFFSDLFARCYGSQGICGGYGRFLPGASLPCHIHDFDESITIVKASRVINSGQVCNCAERVYVQRSVAQEFTDKLSSAMSATHFGDPSQDETVEYGPLIHEAGFRKVEQLVGGAVKAGATLRTGGKRGGGTGGYYYEPTVLSGCTQTMEVVHKEIFGPVIPLVEFEDLDEAIAFANDCEYGLTSSIYTENLDVALRACQEIRFGETYINRENFEAMQGFHAGWRKSGIGGADGRHGLYEFLQTHVVYIQRH
jgi:quercetin dioxygenase-like cupin family protein